MKRALVVGGARSGKYIALLLNENNYHVTLTDLNTVAYKNELEAKGILVFDNGHPLSLLDTKYDLVIKNPGIKYSADFIVELLNLDYKIYNEIEIALRFKPNVNVFAISGTNGKTTTVSLLYQMLKLVDNKTFLGGNIGIPISEIIYKEPEINNLVIELSSFQLDGMYDFKCKYAALTNLNADHLDYYNSEEEYYLSKQKIYKNQSSDDFFFLNNDDKTILKYLNNPNSQIINIGINNVSNIEINNDKVYYKDVLLFDVNDLLIVGNHNIENAILASVMAYEAGVSASDINSVISTFSGVEHRIEYVQTIEGVKYYNDSKATNIESVIVALKAFSKPVVLIAGGYDKKISFNKLAQYKDKVKYAILFGETKHQLAEIFENNYIVDDLKEAVLLSQEISSKDDIVLFSPACASFDQFKDYEERGKLFKQYVKEGF